MIAPKITPLVVATVILCAVINASANELNGNFSWQFRTPNEKLVDLQALDLIERKRGGAFKIYNNYNSSTYFAGDQVNCSVSATALGSSSSTDVTGASSSPSVSSIPGTTANAIGNNLEATYSNEWPTNANLPLSASQTGTTSPVRAVVSGTTSTVDIASLQAAGGQLHQALNTTQSNLNSPQNATVSSSTACVSPGSQR